MNANTESDVTGRRRPRFSAPEAIDLYLGHMSAGKVLLVANPNEIPPD